MEKFTFARAPPRGSDWYYSCVLSLCRDGEPSAPQRGPPVQDHCKCDQLPFKTEFCQQLIWSSHINVQYKICQLWQIEVNKYRRCKSWLESGSPISLTAVCICMMRVFFFCLCAYSSCFACLLLSLPQSRQRKSVSIVTYQGPLSIHQLFPRFSVFCPSDISIVFTSITTIHECLVLVIDKRPPLASVLLIFPWN